jgi:hypothetical protein
MLEDFDRIVEEDKGGFLTRLAALPHSYLGPDGVQAGPYALEAFGEAKPMSQILSSWIDAGTVGPATQFVLAGGLTGDELEPLVRAAASAGTNIVVVGDMGDDTNYVVPRDPLSLYSYFHYLGYATGHGAAVREADDAMRLMCDRLRPEALTEVNPAKALAWTLWNRVPLLLTSRQSGALQPLVQQVFARVGKSVASPAGDHPLLVAAGAFEGRHSLGDDLVGLVLGESDAELEVVSEVLETRIAQFERMDGDALLGVELQDRVANFMLTWYLSLWVAAYLALLHHHDPGNDTLYLSAASAVEGKERALRQNLDG